MSTAQQIETPPGHMRLTNGVLVYDPQGRAANDEMYAEWEKNGRPRTLTPAEYRLLASIVKAAINEWVIENCPMHKIAEEVEAAFRGHLKEKEDAHG